MKHKTDAQWEAETDAQTLANAAVIKADKGKFARAKKAAVKMAKEEQIKTNVLKRISKGKK